jgi:hypothetical protein
MKGAGYHDAHSEYQRRRRDRRRADPLDRRIDRARRRARRAFAVADYGAGTGATSVHAVRTAVAAVRERDAELPVLAIHNDVITNDFTTLFASVAGTDGLGVALDSQSQ